MTDPEQTPPALPVVPRTELAEALTVKGLSLRALENAAGGAVSKGTIAKMRDAAQNGIPAAFTRSKADALAAALGEPVDDLFIIPEYPR